MRSIGGHSISTLAKVSSSNKNAKKVTHLNGKRVGAASFVDIRRFGVAFPSLLLLEQLAVVDIFALQLDLIYDLLSTLEDGEIVDSPRLMKSLLILGGRGG